MLLSLAPRSPPLRRRQAPASIRSPPKPLLLLLLGAAAAVLLPPLLPSSLASIAVPDPGHRWDDDDYGYGYGGGRGGDGDGDVRFRRRVDAALSRVRSLLETTKSPRRVLISMASGDVEHDYDDKYSLTEFVANAGVASVVGALEGLVGVGSGDLLWLKGAGDEEADDAEEGGAAGAKLLRFASNETCSFVEKKVLEIVDSVGSATKTKQETYETDAAGGEPKRVEEETRTAVVREVVEYHWRFELSHELLLVAMGDRSSGEIIAERTIQSRTGSEVIVVTGSERAPCKPHRSLPTLDVDLGWFLERLTAEEPEGVLRSRFRIDRDSPSCRTPRRNDDVEDAARRFEELRRWGWGVSSYFQDAVASRLLSSSSSSRREMNPDNDPKKGSYFDDVSELLRSVDDSALFVPVLPLFREEEEEDGDGDGDDLDSGPVLSGQDADALFGEQRRTIDRALAAFDGTFGGAAAADDYGGIASLVEYRLILLSRHLSSISSSFRRGVDRVEGVLRDQLASAAGREISSKDFDDFVRSFYPRLFRAEYVPEPFVYAVRHPDHYPDGTLSVEDAPRDGDGGSFVPILTFARRVEGPSPMRMPINAATSVELGGEQFLHAWIRTEFGGGGAASRTRLVARARQFSSFLLCIGNVDGPNTFRPKHAIILQNKDEVIVPLLLDPLPTPREFRDAVRGLSPEQGEFARAFRTMQLESSAFGVAIVRLRPQLEDVLCLPPNSLTKEIKLTQSLLQLFIEYQIPPDLLSYDGDATAADGVDEKLSRVKENVAAVQAMIDEAKERELKEAKLRSNMESGGEKRRRTAQKMAYHGREASSSAMMAEDMPMMVDAMPEMVHAQRSMLFSASASATSSSAPHDGANARHLRATTTGREAAADVVREEGGVDDGTGELGNAIDYSNVAKKLDAAFDEFDVDAALRPTKILVQDAARWEKNYHRTLLTPQEKAYISQDEKKRERDKAFDLLDALSKSGVEPIRHSELHVIVAATHRFDHSLIDTVIRENANPITSVERSALIVSSTIHDVPVTDLVIGQGRLSSVERHSPGLLEMGKQRTKDEEDGLMESAESSAI